MAPLDLVQKRKLMFLLLKRHKDRIKRLFILLQFAYAIVVRHHEKYGLKARYFNRDVARTKHLNRLIYSDNVSCFELLRMDRFTFTRLCDLLQTKGRLRDTKNMKVDEQVAMFLIILGHHYKNRCVKFHFMRSGETISRQFRVVLNAVIRLQDDLFKKPEPIPENSRNARWKWFKNCIGALDGTHIPVKVPETAKPRYRNRKGDITTNLLAACSQDMDFIFVLPGWEGSAADGRVLRDAVTREDGLEVPNGCYYLVDAGYTNGNGFLAPFRGQRYHLNEWRSGRQPTTSEEFFNMKHASARNVIERCFGVLKKRWTILNRPLAYPIKIQNRIILACCLLHNFVRKTMAVDPFEVEVEDELNDLTGQEGENGEMIRVVETSNQWTEWRRNLANQMFNEWKSSQSNTISV